MCAFKSTSPFSSCQLLSLTSLRCAPCPREDALPASPAGHALALGSALLPRPSCICAFADFVRQIIHFAYFVPTTCSDWRCNPEDFTVTVLPLLSASHINQRVKSSSEPAKEHLTAPRDRMIVPLRQREERLNGLRLFKSVSCRNSSWRPFGFCCIASALLFSLTLVCWCSQEHF